MTLGNYLRILRERWRAVAALAVVGLLLAVGLTVTSSKVYQADAQVFVSSNNFGDPLAQAQAAAFAQSQVATYASIVASADVLQRVKQDLNLTVSDQVLRSKISATAPSGRSLVDISVQDGSPAVAAQLANSVASAFVAVIEADTTPSGSSTPTVLLKVTDPAVEPTSPVSPKPALYVVIGLLLGLLAGFALAVAREVLDRRVKDPDALAKIVGTPVMGIVVDDPKTARHVIATRAGTRNVRAENFRQLRANLQFANVDAHPRVIAVTSSIPGEGKTTLAVNLASTLAEAGFSVCLVDGDLRRPTVAKVLGLPSPVGLTSVLIHQIEITEAMQSAGSNLFVLTSGPTPPNPSEVLASSYVRQVIRSLLDRVDYVIVDTAPLLPVADGAEVAAMADGTLLVARHGVTTDQQLKRSAHILARVDATLLGVVLNRVPKQGRNDPYGYTYYRAESERASHSKRG